MKFIITIFLSLVILPAEALNKGTNYFNKENTTYVIRRNYDLAGKTITIPAGCTLRFKGGIIKNGCLKGTGTTIEAGNQQLFETSTCFKGSWRVDSWIPEWFGAKGERGQNDAEAIQCALDAARDTDTKIVKLQSKTYYTDETLNIYPYTSFIGAEKTAYWIYASQISPTSNVDAIRITTVGNEVRSTGVTMKNLIIRNGSGELYSKIGILLSNDNENFGITRLSIENVQVLFFDYGLKAELYGNDAPLAYCSFHNLECNNNIIGFYVDGHFEGGKNGHMAWMNVNRFEFCHFSENRIGGLRIQNVWMLLNNVFDQCTFEGNGNNYSLSLYKKEGSYGAKIDNWYTPTTGGNVFQNCYFEMNIPRRQNGDAEVGEYKYGQSIFPEGFFKSKMTGNVILRQHDFSFSNCISSRNKCFVLLTDNCHINVTGTSIFDLEKVSESDSVRFFIEFNDAFVQSSVNTERNHFMISKENTLKYFNFLATPKGAQSKYTIKKMDDIDGGKVELNDMKVGALLNK